METCDVGSRLAVESRETPCVATLNNTRAYFSIARTMSLAPLKMHDCLRPNLFSTFRRQKTLYKFKLLRETRMLGGKMFYKPFRHLFFKIVQKFYEKVTHFQTMLFQTLDRKFSIFYICIIQTYIILHYKYRFAAARLCIYILCTFFIF